MKIIDLKDMPGADLSVTNGMDSVSKDRVFFGYSVGGPFYQWTDRVPRPMCRKHGAMNRVSRDGIYRCLQEGCHEGCYLVDK